jgi:hypothetical protein
MYFDSSNGKMLTAFFISAILFTSCQKDPFAIFKDGNARLGNPVVLVAGYESNGTNNVATCWIDGQEIKLSDGSFNGTANSILVSNNDLYIAGSDNGAVYWKNTREKRLAAGGSATSMFISGNDIYVAGSNGSDSPNAVYWKNGVEVLLPKMNVYGNFGSFGVNSIFVSGHDVYAAGYEGPNAVYWKNGKEIYLTGSTVGAAGYIHAFSIYVSGNDVYVAGHQVSPGSPFPDVAFWKNGVFTPTNNMSELGEANEVIVSGGHVYLAGMNDAGLKYAATAAYWKDGNVTLLPSSESASYATSIFPDGNSLYLSGYEDVDYMHSYAVYWKDGVETKLTDGTHLAAANSIFIK